MRSRMPALLGVIAFAGWAGTAAAQQAVVVEPAVPAFERFSLIYSPEVALQDTSFGSAVNRAGRGNDIQNIGFEISSLTGWFTRYHAQIDFTHGYGANGIRLEPLAFGWALPLVRSPGFGLEVEPLLSLADGILLFTNDPDNGQNVTFLLGSGAEVQLNMIVGPFYAFLSPLGVEVRWLEVTSGTGGSAYGGADPLWRFRVGVGVQY
jgi:hypothetical protein